VYKVVLLWYGSMEPAATLPSRHGGLEAIMAQRKQHTGQLKARVAVEAIAGHNRVRRLMRLMGLEAIYPKPRLSQPDSQEHRKYPYLLRGLSIERPNHVWAADITYIRLWRGFVYLVAIMKRFISKTMAQLTKRGRIWQATFISTTTSVCING